MINRLRSLDLQGYKTFAFKTNFEFPGQVTAIVGPNGSGKSNIADAIRWVLGEQAFTILRGKKTADMIFSGSEQKPRASMASVSIAFDNQSGWLPIDYSEVMITRRAYRSGENEYLLNNQKVRLKEINELLANSGLGDRTYTIIGQGLVDSALSLRPEERRRFFEEAAGIGLYRDRREEAVQKLDKTLRNMERVADITGELSPRLKSLERSREKTIQHKQIQEDLFMLLKDWYGFYWHASIKDLNYAVGFFNQQKENCEEKRVEKEELEEKLNKIQNNLNDNRNQLANLHRELSDCHRFKELDTREIAVLEEREESQKNRIQETENAIQGLELEVDNAKQEYSRLEEVHKVLLGELNTATEQLNIAETKVTEKIKKQAELDSLLKTTRHEISVHQSSVLNLEAEKKNKSINFEEQKGELTRISQYIEDKLIEQSTIKEKITSFNNHIADLEAEIKKQFNVLEQEKKQVENFSKLTEKLSNELQSYDLERSRFTTELAIISEDAENLSGFNSGSHEIVNAQKTGKISGKYNLLIEYLEIPVEYEICIGAALGDWIEGIILEDNGTPEELLEYILQKNIARTAIIQKSKAKTKLRSIENQTLGSDLIRTNNAFSSRIRELLSTTIIVENRKKAYELLTDLQPGWKIATRAGEIFDANGVITAGSPKGIKPIVRKREKKQLENEIILLNKKQTKTRQELDALKKELYLVNDHIVEVQNKINQLNQDLQQLSLNKHKKELEFAQLEKVIVEERGQKEKLKNSINFLEKENPSLQIAIDKEKDIITALFASDRDLLDKLSRIEVENDRMELIDLTSRKAVADEMVKQNELKISTFQTNISNIDAKFRHQKEICQELKLNLEKTRTDRQRLIEKNITINEQIKVLNDKIEPLETIVESVIGKQGKLLENVDICRQQFAVAERHMLQSQIKVEKLENKLDLLRSRIEEDFGLISGESGSFVPTSIPIPFDDLVTSLPIVNELPEGFEETIKQKKSYLRRLGPVNPDAEREYDEVSERFMFLKIQIEDLEKAEKDLRKVVDELDSLMQTKFIQTFKEVDKEFREIFSQLFNGGTAKLYLEEEENILDAGIEIEATLPGRRKQELALLSGGERSLTAVALIFSLLKISPTPFCVLDEVDAMLDESNVVRFGELLRELSDETQFIVITHNRNTVQLADVLYGVTMGKDSVSQVISLKLDELTEELVQ